MANKNPQKSIGFEEVLFLLRIFVWIVEYFLRRKRQLRLETAARLIPPHFA